MTFLQAIAREEGFFVAGTRPARNHNPGDLEFHPWMGKYGAALETGRPNHPARFAAFPSDAQGFAAMRALLLSKSYVGKTVRAALCEWAPSDENDVSSYEANVCTWTGLTPTTILTPEILQ